MNLGDTVVEESAAEHDLIQRIHAAPTRLVLAVTGGGSGAIAALLQTPGASRTVLSAVIPYSAAALDAWLGAAPEHYCAARTARAMAMQAFEAARGYAAAGNAADLRQLAGVGCTASLASDRPKRGSHRYHIGLQTIGTTATWSVELNKGTRSRAAEEHVVARQLLNVVAEACGVAARLDHELSDNEPVTIERTDASADWQNLFSGEVKMVFEGRPVASQRTDRLVFPGAFDPLHDGHREMARVAGQVTGLTVEYEISISNVDKPPLDYTQMRFGADQFGDDATLWFTRAMTFLEKSRLFPGATFIVGVDTMERLIDPRYYGGDRLACRAALEEIVTRGCRFLVFGRTVGGRYQAATEIDLPEPLAAACTPVAESAYRRDVSSTQLRKAGQHVGSDV